MDWITDAQLTVVCDKAGKLRAVTLHEAELVAVSRAMTKHLLANLREIIPTRDILEARPVSLRYRGDRPCIGYSADLSAATDHIGNELASICLRAALLATDAPAWLVEAVPAVCEGVRLEEGPIRCGALMGLGPGWVTLSLANAYAATRAGAQVESFAVCGDDLVGVWPQEVADRYEQTIAKLGLVSNREKSYRGTGAVFCEQFGTLSSAHDGTRLRLRPSVRLAEACGAETRVQGKPLDAGIGQVDSLRDIAQGRWRASGPIRRLAGRTAARLALRGRGLIPGLVREGGSGFGKATAQTLRSFLLGGGQATAPRENERLSKRDRRVREYTAAALESATRRGPGHGTPGLTISEYQAEAARTAAVVESLSLERRFEGKGVRQLHVARAKRVRSSGRVWELLHSEHALRTWTAAARANCWRAFRRARYASAIQSLRCGEHTIIATEVHALRFSETNVVSLRRVASPPVWVPRA